MRLSAGDPKLRAIGYQAGVIAAAVLVGWYLVSNTLANLDARHIASGFGFLAREAGFEIGETTLIPYSAADTYLRALTVGLANTFRVALIGIVAATVLGTLIGLARLSRNWLVAKLATGYVEFIRNVPLLVQLFFWYAIITENLPGPRSAIEPLPHVYLANRGIFFPVPAWNAAYVWAIAAFVAGIAAAFAFGWWANRRQARTGRRPPVLAGVLALLIIPPIAAWLVGGAPTAMSVPALAGFNFSGAPCSRRSSRHSPRVSSRTPHPSSPRSCAPACSPSIAASSRPPMRWGFAAALPCGWWCCPRRCG